ncbi:MAG TPA: hypothetical protein VLX29_03875 [Nitrospirota bacterium]|nr:hypothetical protein [Nitrospirota bacterium]
MITRLSQIKRISINLIGRILNVTPFGFLRQYLFQVYDRSGEKPFCAEVTEVRSLFTPCA